MSEEVQFLEPKLPRELEEKEYDAAQNRQNAKKIIEWLLAEAPEDRPTAADLLRSGLIPVKIEDE